MLLVNASRKQGRAVQRNRFRRRVRMAFLKILRDGSGGAGLEAASGPVPENASEKGCCVVWVRPSRTAAKGCPFLFHEIESQLRLALSRWETR
jgi:hypothetical protein